MSRIIEALRAMDTSARLAAVLVSLVLVVGIACDDRSPQTEVPPTPQALSDSIVAGYERLQQMYASADTLPPDVQRMRGAMGQMHEQMCRQQHGRGGGRHHQERIHGQGMQGRGGMHGDQQHRRRQGGTRDSTQLWEWHQQMMGMHAQLARMHADRGMVKRHRQMQRRHRQMMNALPSMGGTGGTSNRLSVPSGKAARATQGKTLYVQHCASCHGQRGNGVGGAFPPLAGSEWVTGEEDTAIRILLHGLQGRIEVDGRAYNNFMPAFGRRLSDNEVAGLLSFIRSSWGNEAEAVSSEDVADLRRQHSGREQPWTVSQLRDED